MTDSAHPPGHAYSALGSELAAQRPANLITLRHGHGAGFVAVTGQILMAVHTRPGKFGTMKKLLELLVCFIHPLAVVLMWIDLASRRDMASGPKLAWAIFGLIPLVPFLYVLTGGDLW